MYIDWMLAEQAAKRKMGYKLLRKTLDTEEQRESLDAFRDELDLLEDADRVPETLDLFRNMLLVLLALSLSLFPFLFFFR